jgi:hypothetical protein
VLPSVRLHATRPRTVEVAGGGGRATHPGSGKGGLKLTLSVVAEGHLGLAETNCVLAGAGAIELLELRLLDVLHAGQQKKAWLATGNTILGRHSGLGVPRERGRGNTHIVGHNKGGKGR